jgi:hypothetical protein
MQAAHVVPMPPVSECMRWQESVSDEFVRPMHSVLSTKKPICLFGSPGLFPSRRQTRQSIWNYDSRVRFHGRPTSVGLGNPIIVFPLAGGQTL